MLWAVASLSCAFHSGTVLGKNKTMTPSVQMLLLVVVVRIHEGTLLWSGKVERQRLSSIP